MEPPPIPQDLRRFVLTGIPSVPFLEALLLLRANAGQTWRSNSVAERLYVRDRVAQALLVHLCDAGMVQQCGRHDTPEYRHHPGPLQWAR